MGLGLISSPDHLGLVRRSPGSQVLLSDLDDSSGLVVGHDHAVMVVLGGDDGQHHGDSHDEKHRDDHRDNESFVAQLDVNLAGSDETPGR